jgi:protease-4
VSDRSPSDETDAEPTSDEGGDAEPAEDTPDDEDPPSSTGTSPDDAPPTGPASGPAAELVSTGDRLGRFAVVAVGTLIATAVGWLLFVVLPGTLADLLGVLLAVGVAVLGVRAAGRLADRAFPDYNVAEVAVEGPITRDGGSPNPLGAVQGTPADDVVDQIEAADEDDAVDALVVELNTPGGEIVPSDDIRAAARSFDGPTVAYATDTCASGGYWIASGCDELWARENSLVGSIGVIGSRPNAADLADRLGVSYERFAAGKYKDAGNPLKEPTEDDRAYLQGLIDEFYDDFVERVAEGRGIDEDAVRETEARVYLGREARDRGLVDAVGDRDAVLERVEGLLGVEASVRAFEPSRGIAGRIRGGATAVAYAAGAGVAGAVAPEDGEVDLRLRR